MEVYRNSGRRTVGERQIVERSWSTANLFKHMETNALRHLTESIRRFSRVRASRLQLLVSNGENN